MSLRKTGCWVCRYVLEMAQVGAVSGAAASGATGTADGTAAGQSTQGGPLPDDVSLAEEAAARVAAHAPRPVVPRLRLSKAISAVTASVAMKVGDVLA